MVRLEAKNLHELYGILEEMPKPIAVIDFISGEMGYELLMAQVLGGLFYDFYRNVAKVIALCWIGGSLLYSNVSDIQIELVDVEKSIRGNRKHQAVRRLEWLKSQSHSIQNIDGIIAHFPPTCPSQKLFKRIYGLSQDELIQLWVDRIAETRPVFNSEVLKIETPYIVVFDRNDVHQPERNTKLWQIALLHQMTQKHGLDLVLISGFNPRPAPSEMRFSLVHRDLDLLCNLTQRAVFFAGPPSGMTTTAIMFGCNFLSLGHFYGDRDKTATKIIGLCGFQHLGFFVESELDTTLNTVETFLIDEYSGEKNNAPGN